MLDHTSVHKITIETYKRTTGEKQLTLNDRFPLGTNYIKYKELYEEYL